MWGRVESEFNSRKDERAPIRDVDSIRNKYKTLKNSKKPTGDPTCPPCVVRAIRLAREIENGVGAFNLGDSSSSDDSESEQSSIVIYSEPSSPIQPRLQLIGQNPSVYRIIEESAPQLDVIILDSFNVQDAQKIDDNQSEPFIPDEEQFEADDEKNSRVPLDGKNSQSAIYEKIPHRLGVEAPELKKVMDELAKKRKNKKGVPENATHTKKRALAEELKDLDDEYEREKSGLSQSYALQQKCAELRHVEEMRRLDQANALAERRFEAESARHTAMMTLLVSAVFGNRGANDQPHPLVQAIIGPRAGLGASEPHIPPPQ